MLPRGSALETLVTGGLPVQDYTFTLGQCGTRRQSPPCFREVWLELGLAVGARLDHSGSLSVTPAAVHHQSVLLHVPNGLNGLPPAARSTKTSIVFFGPGPAVDPNANPLSRK